MHRRQTRRVRKCQRVLLPPHTFGNAKAVDFVGVL